MTTIGSSVTKTRSTSARPYRQRPWRSRRAYDMSRPSLAGLVLRYALLLIVAAISIWPFLFQVSTSFKGAFEDIYAFPPSLVPQQPSTAAYESVSTIVPVYSYAFNSLKVALAQVVSQVVLATLAGYALAKMQFRGKRVVLGILLSTMLLPGEVTLMSQFLIVNQLGAANSLVGVYLPGAIGAINVLLMMVACQGIPTAVIDAATIDGANTVQRIRHIVWPNVRGMASVVGVFSFIGAWDDFLWPLLVLSDPTKYTLTVGMAYLDSAIGANPRQIAAGTVIALIPVIIIFATMQRFFFRGVESGALKG